MCIACILCCVVNLKICDFFSTKVQSVFFVETLIMKNASLNVFNHMALVLKGTVSAYIRRLYARIKDLLFITMGLPQAIENVDVTLLVDMSLFRHHNIFHFAILIKKTVPALKIRLTIYSYISKVYV